MGVLGGVTDAAAWIGSIHLFMEQHSLGPAVMSLAAAQPGAGSDSLSSEGEALSPVGCSEI